MARLQLSMFLLNQGFPQLFTKEDERGKHFVFGGQDPDNAENELYVTELEDGTYYLVLDTCDDGGNVTGRTLEHLVVHGDVIDRMEMARTPHASVSQPALVAAAYNAPFSRDVATQ